MTTLVCLVLLQFMAAAAHAQDTTQTYPWRLSYFPYLTASPNDGVMAMGRIVVFRQSRWNDRVSLADEVAVEGGYSTKDSWLARVRGDFPRLAPGWRLQVVAQAERTVEEYEGDGDQVSISALRQFVAAEVSRTLGGPFLLAVRGEASHVGIPATGAVTSPRRTFADESQLSSTSATANTTRDQAHSSRAVSSSARRAEPRSRTPANTAWRVAGCPSAIGRG